MPDNENKTEAETKPEVEKNPEAETETKASKKKETGTVRVTMPPQMQKDLADLGTKASKGKKLFLPDGTEVKKFPEGGTLTVSKENARRLKASGWS